MPWVMLRQERIRHCGPVAERPVPVPKPCRSDRFYVPEFAELTRVVLSCAKRTWFSHDRVQFPDSPLHDQKLRPPKSRRIQVAASIRIDLMTYERPFDLNLGHS